MPMGDYTFDFARKTAPGLGLPAPGRLAVPLLWSSGPLHIEPETPGLEPAIWR